MILYRNLIFLTSDVEIFDRAIVFYIIFSTIIIYLNISKAFTQNNEQRCEHYRLSEETDW